MDQVLATGLAPNGRGGLAAAALVSDGTLRVAAEILPGGVWSGWGQVGHPPDQILNQGASLACSPTGELSAAAVDTGGDLRVVEAVTEPGTWGPWENVGRPGGGLAGTLGTACPASGGCRVVAVTGAGTLACVEGSGGTWGPWTPVPTSGVPPNASFTRGLGVCAPPTGGIVVAAVVNGTSVSTVTGSGASWGTWQAVPGSGLPAGQSLGPAAVAVNAAGDVTLVVIASDGCAYVATSEGTPGSSDATWSPWSALGHPPSTFLVNTTTTIGVAADDQGRLALVAAANDGNAYLLPQPEPGDWPGTWECLGDPDDPTALWSDSATGPNLCAASVLAPRVSGDGAARPDRRPLPTALLRLRTPAATGVLTIDVPEGSPFLAGAVLDTQGEFPPGVVVSVLDPTGKPPDWTVNDPGAPEEVAGGPPGSIDYFLVKSPLPGTWTLQIHSTDPDSADYQAWMAAMPYVNPVSSLARTFEHLGDEEALAALGLSWRCIGCTAGLLIGGAALTAAIVAGITLFPESAVVVWLAETLGVTSEAAIQFIAAHLTDVDYVVGVAQQICHHLHACD